MLAHSRAISVWSGERVALSDLPIVFTSLRSVAYAALVSIGGRTGRNCVDEIIASGTACCRWVKVAAELAGGVGCQRPGNGGSEYGGNSDTSQPSFWRHA